MAIGNVCLTVGVTYQSTYPYIVPDLHVQNEDGYGNGMGNGMRIGMRNGMRIWNGLMRCLLGTSCMLGMTGYFGGKGKMRRATEAKSFCIWIEKKIHAHFLETVEARVIQIKTVNRRAGRRHFPFV